MKKMLLSKRDYDKTNRSGLKNRISALFALRPPKGIMLNTSTHAAVKDGAACSVMLGSGEAYLSPYAIFLQGTAVQIGLLTTLPLLIGSLFQILAVRMMRFLKRRKRTCIVAASLQAFTWLIIATIPAIFGFGPASVSILILTVAIYFAFGHLLVPIWSSLIGDLVPAEIRGRYFGYRNRISGFASIGALVAGGFLLNFANNWELSYYAFIALFLVAFIARGASAYYLSRYEDPEILDLPENRFSFYQFIRRSRHSNFAHFVFFTAAMNFSVFFAGPYFALYMLRAIELSYIQFMLVVATGMAAQFGLMQYWGPLSDRFGNKKILNFCGGGLALASLLWIFSSNIYYLLAVQLFSGFLWSGYLLAGGNFLFDAVSAPKRARCTAYLNFITASLTLTGSLLGGWLLRYLQSFTDSIGADPANPFLIIFGVSALLRLLSAVFFLPSFKEVRSVENAKYRDLIFRANHLRPISGATLSFMTSIVKKK